MTYGAAVLAAFSVFGFGNLMNFAVIPILLVDHFDAPNTFVGILAAVQSLVAIGAFLYWGRMIDRGSSLRLSLYNALLMLLVPIGYLVAPTVWALLGVAIVFGIAIAAGDLTYHTNVVQLAPPGRVTEYAAAQSFLLGVRGTAAPFVASALMGLIEPRAVLLVGLGFMVVGAALLSRVARAVAPTPAVEVAASS
jgi:MFS family permease